MAEPIRKQMHKRILCLDLVRLFSCLCVVVVHFNASVSVYDNGLFLYPNSITPNYYLDGRVYLGQIGVNLFFILSGAAQMLTYQAGDVRGYYKKRFLSIFPMFWIAFATVTAIDFLISKAFPSSNPLLLAYSFVGMDGYMSVMGLMGGQFYKVGEWFLGCILLLYVFFPLLHTGIKKTPVLTAVAAVGIYVLFSPSAGVIRSKGFEFYLMLPEIVFGMLFAEFKLWEGKKALWLFFASAVLLAAAILLKDAISYLTLSNALCLMLFSLITLLSRFIQNEKWIALISRSSILTYPIFLVHHRVIDYLARLYSLPELTRKDVWLLLLIYAAITLAASWILEKAGRYVLKSGVLTGKAANVLWTAVLIGIIALPIVSIVHHFI